MQYIYSKQFCFHFKNAKVLYLIISVHRWEYSQTTASVSVQINTIHLHSHWPETHTHTHTASFSAVNHILDRNPEHRLAVCPNAVCSGQRLLPLRHERWVHLPRGLWLAASPRWDSRLDDDLSDLCDLRMWHDAGLRLCLCRLILSLWNLKQLHDQSLLFTINQCNLF